MLEVNKIIDPNLLQYYNFCMNFNRIKCLTLSLMFLSSVQAWSAGKSDKYDQMMKLGSAPEITKAFKNDNSMARAKIGDEKDSLLMRAIMYDRDISIIALLYRGGVSDNTRNKNGQDVLSYACRYSTDKAVIKKILLKTCPQKKANEILSKKDKTGKSPLDYAKENPKDTALTIIEAYIQSNPEKPEENPVITLTADEDETDTLEDESASEEVAEETAENNAVADAETKTEAEAKTSEPAPAAETKEVPASSETAETPVAEKEPKVAEAPVSAEVPAVAAAATVSIAEKEPETNAEAEEFENQAATESEQKPEEIIPASSAIETKKYDKVFLYDFALQEEDPVPEEDEQTLELAVIEFPNRQDKNGKTALMTASKEGNDWEIRSLLKSKADVNITDKDGWTALMYAVRYQNNLDLINCLLQAGANPDIKNKYGSSALQIAAGYTSNPDILKKLTSISKASADDMFKAFIMAITSNTTNSLTQVSKLNVFLSYGVPINRFYEGRTPLMYAAEYSASTEVIKLLLDNGAAKNLRTPDGKTVFNFAESNKLLDHNEIYWSLNQQ